MAIGDYIGANIVSTEGLKYIDDSYKKRGLHHNISISYREQGNHSEALKWNSKAQDLVKSSKLSKKDSISETIKLKITEANILSDIGKYDKSISILNRLEKDAIADSNPFDYARIQSNLGFFKWLRDNNSNDGLYHLLEALKLRQKINDQKGLIATYIHLSRFYLNKNQKKALENALLAREKAINLGNQEDILELLDIITEIDEDNSKYLKAYKKASIESMKLQKQARQIYAPIRFENEKLVKEKEEKQIEIKKKNTWITTIIIVSSILFLLLWWWLWRKNFIQKQRSKIEKLEATYETEKRISQKVHDEIANNIHVLMAQVEDENAKDVILDELEVVYHLARDISRSNSDIDVEDGFTDELRELLAQYQSNTIEVLVSGIQTIPWQQTSRINKIMLYRVLQELMVNMKKHSQATTVSVIFKIHSNRIVIRYTDNGIGFSNNKSNGLGLNSVENRIRTIRGRINFTSRTGKGLSVDIDFPL